MSVKTHEGTAKMLALVFLDRNELSDSAGLANLLVENFPHALRLETSEADVSKPPFMFKDGSLLFSLLHVAAPAPIQVSDPEINNAHLWPNAKQEIMRHRSHLIIAVSGGSDVYDCAYGLQHVLSLVYQAEPAALGSVLPDSGAVFPRKAAFLLAETGKVATPLFISCFIAMEVDASSRSLGTCGVTKGLDIFGLREIQARGFRGSVSALLQFLLSFSTYLVTARPTIEDGHTVGVSETDKVVVRIRRSEQSGRDFYCLQFG